MLRFPYPPERGAGVYEIRCTATDKVYVGSTRTLRKRLCRHVDDLRHGKHHSPHLQRAWDKHGESAFSIAVLEVFPEDLTDAFQIEREQFWLHERRSYEPEHGYNILQMAFSRSGHRASEAARQNMSEAGKGRKLTEEWRENIRKSHLGSKSHRAVLNEAQVAAIKQRLASGERAPKLAQEFGVERTTVYMIAQGKTWSHVLPELEVNPHRNAGARHHNSKLTEQLVREIRERLKQGETPTSLARNLNLSPNTVYDIQKERTWKHLL